MIRPTVVTRQRCFICGRSATREVLIEGHSDPMCDGCPDPVEVYQRAAELRSGWPPYRWAQARTDERHGEPIAFDNLDRIVHVDRERTR